MYKHVKNGRKTKRKSGTIKPADYNIEHLNRLPGRRKKPFVFPATLTLQSPSSLSPRERRPVGGKDGGSGGESTRSPGEMNGSRRRRRRRFNFLCSHHLDITARVHSPHTYTRTDTSPSVRTEFFFAKSH